MSTTVTPGTGHEPGHAHEHGHADPTVPVTYGLLAEFETADEMSHATAKATAAGYTHMDAYSPYPVGEAADALNFPKSEMGPIMFIGGLTGACAGFTMQYWANTWGYSLNIGGRPYFSWPSFVPITFEMMVLTTALTGLFGFMALCGLPRYNHPLFNSTAFDRATRDRFFLCVEATDPKFDLAATRAFLNDLHPLSVEEVME
ncbi:Quinol:cytochrome c oxidoreductase membrane protein OS=Chloracidobacterium thermophilum (strain B) GN=Cabther_B0239 PE=4 SV=1: DUF3341 [Gemmata massiliana]|uniref:DUF3341 domain-containing protein n=1 Tax=Gemmata massiliana TaxID=1210884 RepID=A0A6P2CUU9_9BACT|nr:DUF3341 domain-containing protein [Gemmata massiliana]VTR92347.1 Quinol:cytochrome c oxidoreductase membrane protein OS=Chloracidobacterium thermophilum (strain B) GN=Cabther_B0239 PE=4 SV=1: DUF3341 [Gemmata massiliana]